MADLYLCTSGVTHGQPYASSGDCSIVPTDSASIASGFVTKCTDPSNNGVNVGTCSTYDWNDVQMLVAGDLLPATDGLLHDADSLAWGFDFPGGGEPPPDPDPETTGGIMIVCPGQVETNSSGVALCKDMSGAPLAWAEQEAFELSNLDPALMSGAYAAGFVIIAMGWAISRGAQLVLSMLK